MIKKNKFILGLLVVAVSSCVVNYKAMIRADAEALQLGAYNTEEDKDIPVNEAVDENGITWDYKLLKDGTVYIQYAKNVQANMIIPEKLKGRIVSVIGDIVQYKSTDHDSAPLPDTIIQSVKIPSTVRFIGPYAFHCSNLTDVDMPSNTWIAEGAFKYTPWFEKQRDSQGLVIINNMLLSAKNPSGNITIPSNVKEIGERAFGDQLNITGVSIPNSVKEIGASAFSGCNNLKNVTLPNNITKINDSTFAGCFKIESIAIPDGVTEIGNSAFSDCVSLKDVTIPDSVTDIKNLAFGWCDNLEKIKISNSKIHIENGAFNSCKKLADVELPSTASIDDGAFTDTAWLCNQKNSDGLLIVNNVLINAGNQKEEFKVPDGVTAIGSKAFENWTSLKKVDIPSSVKEIGDKAFSGCSNLNNITIPDSVTKIGSYAFEECVNLEQIKIPGSVQEIGEYAFVSCSKLNEVILNDGIKTIGTGAFALCKNIKKIEIPSTVINTYQDTAFDEGVTIVKNGSSYINKNPYNNTAAQANTVQQGWHKDGYNWNWLWSDGTKRTGWYAENGQWYYFYGNGQMATEFIDLGGGYSYYLKPNSSDGKAVMVTGWQYIGGDWFYFNPNSDGYQGAMKRACWDYIDGNWYYFYYDGTMAHNTYIDGYYVNSSGAWV